MSSVTLDVPSAVLFQQGAGGCSKGWVMSVGSERQGLAACQADRAKLRFLWVCLSEKGSDKATRDGRSGTVVFPSVGAGTGSQEQFLVLSGAFPLASRFDQGPQNAQKTSFDSERKTAENEIERIGKEQGQTETER